ncbi:MAG: TonB-dependent receptor, partial [Gammaproteobacteria bacterium]
MTAFSRSCQLAVATLLSVVGTIAAQEPEEILVIGVVPTGAGVDRDKIPYPVQAANNAALQDINAVSIADFLELSFNGVSLNDAQNNPLQPDLQYRGFTLSPLLGLAQGMAVYQNGVRINEPLGDAVNWDLLPQSAIEDITLTGGTTPLFGLNSLGGSLAINMKDGFSYQGQGIEVSAGSFGRSNTSLEIGDNNGTVGYYANIEYFEEDGWRDYSKSDALNFYGSLSWRGDASQINFNYQHGDSELTGNGASPVELIALNRAAIFTGPDITENNLHMVSVDFEHAVSSSIRFGGNLFYRKNDSDSFNGDGSEFAICQLGGLDTLIEGLEEDDLEELGLDQDDVCDSQYANADVLEDFLNDTAEMFGGDD